MKHIYLVILSTFFLFSSCYHMLSSEGGGQGNIRTDSRPVNAADVALPPGYRIEPVATGLTYPTDVALDEQGRLHVIEAGYSYGEDFLEPRLLRIEAGGALTPIATGANNGPWTGIEFYKGNFYIAEGGQMQGGKILQVTPGGSISALIENLPSLGDHHTNGPAVGPDGNLYFGIGTATNSGVVGKDNYDFGWLKRNPTFHDIPCQDVVLNGENFESEVPLASAGGTQSTGAYSPYGTRTTKGQVVKGSIPCTGAVLRLSPEGGSPELVAWGFRNPYGLAFSPGGQLYITENGFDERGSRPAWGTGDYLWQVEQGQWYGWPDHAGGLAFNGERFKSSKSKPPKPLMANHPNQPPRPAAVLGVHSSSNGLDFSTSDAFGHRGQAFIAQFGDMAPDVGKVVDPVGFKVIRVDVSNGVITEFAANKGKENGPASWLKKGGLERPVAVKFSPDGSALYIVDFGIMKMTEAGPQPQQKTGMIWKVTHNKR